MDWVSITWCGLLIVSIIALWFQWVAKVYITRLLRERIYSVSMAQQLPAPVSKVPWAVREPSNQALKDSRFYKEVQCSEDKQKSDTNLRLYSLIKDNFFPYYLPERYHSMDCVAIKNMTKVEGHYWNHASHFLLFNQLHEVFLWQATTNYGDDPSLHDQLKSLPLLTTEMKSKMFSKNGIELCQTSAEFLLNPWVLMQLPWKPVLLLQWTAGMMIEFYSLRLELVELYRWQVPFKAKQTVRKLFRLVNRLPMHAFQAFHKVQLRLSSLSADCNCYDKNTRKYLTGITHKLLPMLEFVTSGKARDTVRALKRMCFGKNYRFTHKTWTVQFISIEWEGTYNCMFSDLFWRQGNAKEVLGMHSKEHTHDIQHSASVVLAGHATFDFKATPEWLANMETKYGKKIESGKIFDLLEPSISKGIITNVSNQDLLHGIKLHKTYFTHCYYRLMELKAVIDGGLRDEDAGVLYDVLCARTKYRIADVQCAMLQKLAHYCYEKDNPHIDVQLNALNSEGPSMALHQITEIIVQTNNKMEKNKLSGAKTLEFKLPLNCRSKINPMEECPNLDGEGALEVAKKFEVRIKRMVFNMFEDHETWTIHKIKLHPDWQIVQYVLPCFVASLLEFVECKDVAQNHKQNYVRIVHELIKSFEVDPYKVPSMDGPFPDGYSPYLMVGTYMINVKMWQVELLRKGLRKALGLSTKAETVVETLERNFILVLMDTDKIPITVATHNYHSVVQEKWRIQVYQLFSRILKAIEAAVPGSLPNLMALEMSMMAHICFDDHNSRGPTSSTAAVSKSHRLDSMFEQLSSITKLKARELLGVQQKIFYHHYLNKNTKMNKLMLELANVMENLLLRQCKGLSLEQITALIVFYCVESVTDEEGHHKGMINKTRVPMDRVEEVYFAYHAGDQVALKLLLGKMYTRHGIDFSEVIYEFASKVAPYIYQSALAKVKDGRVQMKEPCELTLIPFKHCRWCGLVQNDVLRLCKECKDDRQFPYRTWFCSDECDRLAMDMLHREEHVRYLLLAIGIEETMRTRTELECKTETCAQNKKKKKSGRAKK